MSDNSTGIIVFTKVPQSGLVKTRIQQPLLSPEFPSILQTAMLLDTIKGLKFIPEKISPVVTYHPEQAKSTFEKLIIKPLVKDDPKFVSTLKFVPQSGETFTDRFHNSFQHVFHNLKLSSALIIGSDTPHLQPTLLQTAIKILQSDPLRSVLGPSQNQGFYLLGHNVPSIDGIGQIFEENSPYGELGNAMDLLLNYTNVHILPEVSDIDEFEDLKSVASIIRLLSLNYERGKEVYLPEHTFNLINTLDTTIWDS